MEIANLDPGSGGDDNKNMLEDQFSEKHRKRRGRRRKFWLAITAIAIVLIATAVLWLFFRSPVFQIRGVTVSGASTVSASDVENLLTGSILADHGFIKSLLGLNNILAWPSGQLASNSLRYLPQLADVSVSKNYFSRSIDVNVTERQPFAIWCEMQSPSGAAPDGLPDAATGTPAIFQSESCFWFDASGTIFEKAYDTEGSALYAVHDYSQTGLGLGQKILPDIFVANFMSIIDAVKQSGITVKEIALKDISLQEIDVSTYNGPDVYFSLQFSAADDLPVLQALMAKPNFKNLKYVDFRVQDRAYYE